MWSLILLGMSHHIPYLAGAAVLGLVLALLVFGRNRTRLGWEHGKGLVPPFTVIGCGSGIDLRRHFGHHRGRRHGGIRRLHHRGVPRRGSVGLLWDSMMRTLRSTGTIIW